MVILSIYDSKAEAFMRPFFVPTVMVGLREFQKMSQEEESPINQFPLDYSLWKLGEFDEFSGEIKPTREQVGSAIEFTRDGERQVGNLELVSGKGASDGKKNS